MVGRILVIDDNPDIARDFAQLLASASNDASTLDELEASLFGMHKQPVCATETGLFEVVGALQGRDGLSQVHRAIQENRPYSVAVIDMRMPPGWNGVETSKRIRDVDPRIRIVICSAYAEQSETEIIQALGENSAVRFLNKPFDPSAARLLLSELQKEWVVAGS